MSGRENKPHIGIFGRCNSGKSTLLNFIVGADAALVSPMGGTTTDVVRKSYEILGFAPVIFIDTPGIDDTSELGRQRIRRTRDTLGEVDLALLVFREWGEPEAALAAEFDAAGVLHILVHNGGSPLKLAQMESQRRAEGASPQRAECSDRQVVVEHEITSARLRRDATAVGIPRKGTAISKEALPIYNGCRQEAINIDAMGVAADDNASAYATQRDIQRDMLLDEIKRRLPEASYTAPSMFGGRVAAGDVVLLVCPIDSEAPAGRMILPQVQALRELLDLHTVAIVVQPSEVAAAFARDGVMKPALVVVDSQVYAEVRAEVPPEIEVTSFSILLAAAKGDIDLYCRGLEAVDHLTDGDRILISESCSHQSGCDDIGRVKIPRWLEAYTGKSLNFTVIPGGQPLPDDLACYALIVQCGACMSTRRQLHNRLRRAAAAGVPVTNYGMLIKKIV